MRGGGVQTPLASCAGRDEWGIHSRLWGTKSASRDSLTRAMSKSYQIHLQLKKNGHKPKDFWERKVIGQMQDKEGKLRIYNDLFSALGDAKNEAQPRGPRRELELNQVD